MQLTQRGEAKKLSPEAKNPGEDAYCDTTYPMETEGVNECGDGKGTKIIRQEDCKYAAKVLGKTMSNITKNDDYLNPNPYVKECFIENDEVFFNPMDSVHTGVWKGAALCMMPIYVNGTKGSATPCPAHYELIETKTAGSTAGWQECMWAHDCRDGAMSCEERTFANDLYQTDEAPHGCYWDERGCYGYNDKAETALSVDAAMSAKRALKTPVCRLKDCAFNADDKENHCSHASTSKPAAAAAHGGPPKGPMPATKEPAP